MTSLNELKMSWIPSEENGLDTGHLVRSCAVRRNTRESELRPLLSRRLVKPRGLRFVRRFVSNLFGAYRQKIALADKILTFRYFRWNESKKEWRRRKAFHRLSSGSYSQANRCEKFSWSFRPVKTGSLFSVFIYSPVLTSNQHVCGRTI